MHVPAGWCRGERTGTTHPWTPPPYRNTSGPVQAGSQHSVAPVLGTAADSGYCWTGDWTWGAPGLWVVVRFDLASWEVTVSTVEVAGVVVVVVEMWQRRFL